MDCGTVLRYHKHEDGRPPLQVWVLLIYDWIRRHLSEVPEGLQVVPHLTEEGAEFELHPAIGRLAQH